MDTTSRLPLPSAVPTREQQTETDMRSDQVCILSWHMDMWIEADKLTTIVSLQSKLTQTVRNATPGLELAPFRIKP